MISFNIVEKVSRDNQDLDLEVHNVWDAIIINHKGQFYRGWYIFYVLCCFSSSYIYGYLAMFGSHDLLFSTTSYVYEAIFIIAIGIEFITDFPKKGTGSTGLCVRDLS